MVRKTGNASLSQPQGPGMGGNGLNDVLKLYGVEECPECKAPLDLSDNRPLKEFCGHIRCRRCLIKATACGQCNSSQQMSSPSTGTNGVSNGPTSVSASLFSHTTPHESVAPTRTYPPQQLRSYSTRNQKAGGIGTGSNNHTPTPNRFVSGLDRKKSGITTPKVGLDVKISGRPFVNAPSLSVPSSSTSLTTNLGQFSVGTVRAMKSSQLAKIIPTPSSVATSFEQSGSGEVRILVLPTVSTTIEKNPLPSSSLPSATTVKAMQVLRSLPHNKEPSPVPSSDTSTRSNNPESSESDEPNSPQSELKDKKKKKRHPVVIHDHITVISGEPTMFQCNVCMKKFKTKAHIKYHEFCQNGEKPFKCEQCGQGFIAKSHYEYHLRTHTGERPYVCPKCGKGFNQRGKVTRHMRSHTGEKPFVCDECGRGFANAQALRSHNLIHTGERPFACKYCNKRFTGMTNLKKHIITHTGERPYSCTHCGKSFGLKWTLDLHSRTHSSERPYACEQCSRAFSNNKDLRRHLVIHSGERPFKCWICQTAFRRKDNLDRHIKNTHNQPKEVAKQLANEAAAEYLAINSNPPVPVSKVNSAVISNVIRTAQLNAGATAPKIQKKEKTKMKPTLVTKKKSKTKLKSKKLSKPKPVLDSVSNENEYIVPNEVHITADLSPRLDTTNIEQNSNSPANIEQKLDYSESKIEQHSQEPKIEPGSSSPKYDSTSPPHEETSPNDIVGNQPAQKVESTVIFTQDSPQLVNEEKIESETFENYILPDSEDSYMRFTSNVEVEEQKFQPESSTGSFMEFAECPTEQKLRHESPNNADGLSDFSKSRNLTPSDCGIRLFDKVVSAIPPEAAQLDLTSIIPHGSSWDEDAEHVFVDEKETQTIFEEFNESNLDENHGCKILVGRPRSIFPEEEYEDADKGEKESSCSRDKETTPKDEDMDREDFICQRELEETSPEAENMLISIIGNPIVSQPSPKSAETPSDDMASNENSIGESNESSPSIKLECDTTLESLPTSCKNYGGSGQPISSEYDEASVPAILDETTSPETSFGCPIEVENMLTCAIENDTDTQPAHKSPETQSEIENVITNVDNMAIASPPSPKTQPETENMLANANEHAPASLSPPKSAETPSETKNMVTSVNEAPGSPKSSEDMITNIDDNAIGSPPSPKAVETSSDPEDMITNVDVIATESPPSPKSPETRTDPEDMITNVDVIATESPPSPKSPETPTDPEDMITNVNAIASPPSSQAPETPLETNNMVTSVNETLGSPKSLETLAEPEDAVAFLPSPKAPETPTDPDDTNVDDYATSSPPPPHETEPETDNILANANEPALASPLSPLNSPETPSETKNMVTSVNEAPGSPNETPETPAEPEDATAFPPSPKAPETQSEIENQPKSTLSPPSALADEGKCVEDMRNIMHNSMPVPTESLSMHYTKMESAYENITTTLELGTEQPSPTVEEPSDDEEETQVLLKVTDGPRRLAEPFNYNSHYEIKEEISEAPFAPTSPPHSHTSSGIGMFTREEKANEAKLTEVPSVPQMTCARFYFHENPEEPYSGNSYLPHQIGIDHPYSPGPDYQKENLATMDILYSTATAQMEANYDESGPPFKIRLLTAEAFGVQNGEDMSDHRIFYTSARPNQVLDNYSSPTIELLSPAILHSPETRGSSPLVTIHRYHFDQDAPLPNPPLASQPQVSYDENGIFHIETICDQPERSSLVKRAREASRTFAETGYYAQREWTPMYHFNQNSHQDHVEDLRIHPHPQPIPSYSQTSQMSSNYYGVPNDPQHRVNYHTRPQEQSSPEGYKFHNPLQELAAEASRRLCQGGQEEYNATIAAATAIAAVGEEARKQREEELKNRLLSDERVRIH